MTKSKTICVITGTRAEYGLLYWVIKAIDEDPDLELQLVATGMHLSPEFGLTYREIEKDGFQIDKKVELLLSSDTPVGVSKSVGVGVIGFAEAFAELKPDAILVLGDRFEILAAAVAAMIARIPIAHCNGGETTEGAFDESIRHCLTKMSHLHFTSTDVYKARVIQMGEHPDRVFNTGALSMESIKNLPLLSRDDLEKAIGFKLNKKNILVTYHPVTLEEGVAREQMAALLEAVDGLKDTHIIFTMPNADPEGRIIKQLIDDYVSPNSKKAVVFTSMGQLRYLSAMQHVDAVVGNSSSGIVEAPGLKTATVDIGDRQRGRIRADSVVHCAPAKSDIAAALRKVFSDKFQASLPKVKNPFGEGNTSEQIIAILKRIQLDGLLKKSFYNIDLKL